MINTRQFAEQHLHLEDPALLQEIEQICSIQSVKQGTHIIDAGTQQMQLVFLYSGLFRSFTPGSGSRETTDSFSFRIGDPLLGSFDLQAPACRSIEAMEDCLVFSAPMPFVHSILSRYPEASNGYTRIIQNALTRCWTMKLILQKCNSRARYQWFLDEYPSLSGRVPQKYISSFLGTTPENLSRIRSNPPASRTPAPSVSIP